MTLTRPSKYLIETFPTQKKGRTKQGDKAYKTIPIMVLFRTAQMQLAPTASLLILTKRAVLNTHI